MKIQSPARAQPVASVRPCLRSRWLKDEVCDGLPQCLSADMHGGFKVLVASSVVQAFSPRCVAQRSWLGTLSMAVAPVL